MAADDARTVRGIVSPSAPSAAPSAPRREDAYAASAGSKVTENLKELALLKESGALTEEEFTTAKAQVLADGSGGNSSAATKTSETLRSSQRPPSKGQAGNSFKDGAQGLDITLIAWTRSYVVQRSSQQKSSKGQSLGTASQMAAKVLATTLTKSRSSRFPKTGGAGGAVKVY